ncbi:MAG: helix-turn-helix transcriptional regulator [Candidatus Aminicenantes bacterium]|nr:helix-turn-helix transcriptional regulator [Candidatus Aminicenantes bacterium]
MKGLTRKEELILLTIRALDRDAYLVAITDHLASAVGERMTLPSVHVPLTRLEKMGYIASELGEGSPVRGGRRKKIYRITKAGYRALNEYKRISENLWEAVSSQTGRKD